jgi:hypothetical protein
MPSDDGFRWNDDKDRWPKAKEPNPEESVPRSEFWAIHGTPQDDDLVSQSEDLGLERETRLKAEEEGWEQGNQNAEHESGRYQLDSISSMFTVRMQFLAGTTNYHLDLLTSEIMPVAVSGFEACKTPTCWTLVKMKVDFFVPADKLSSLPDQALELSAQ